MERHFIQAPTALIETIVKNRESDRSILLLSGGPGLQNYLDGVGSMMPKDMFTIQFNQRGTGQSKCLNKQFRVEDYLDDIRSILLHYQIQKPHLFGHGWGGLLAQLYANKYPNEVGSLFLCNSFIGTGIHWKLLETEIDDFFKERLKGFRRLVYGSLKYLSKFTAFDAPKRKHLAYMLKSYKRCYYKEKKAEYPDFKAYPQVVARTRSEALKSNIKLDIKAGTIPTLIVNGKKDFLKEDRWRLEERWPFAQKIELEQAGHFPWVEAPKEFYQILIQFYGIKPIGA